MRWILAAIFSLLALQAAGQAVPGPLTKLVQRDPLGFADDVAVIIAGFGKGDAIDRAGLRNLVAMERADARAMALRRLQGADLDGDGAISGGEMRIKAAALAAAARGRLILYFGKADLQGDDAVSADELQIYAETVARGDFSDARAAEIYAIIGFDKNADGRVTLDEVRAAIGLAAAPKSGSASGGGSGDEIDQKLKI